MKIKLNRDCLINGQHCKVGEVVEVSEDDARYLLSRGHAETAEKGAKSKKDTVKRVKVLVLRDCLLGARHAARGDVRSVPDDAHVRYLLNRGHVVKDGTDEAKALKKQIEAERKHAEEAEKKAAEDAAAAADEGSKA